MMNTGPSATRQPGFTLLEVLVALLVFAIGLLGAAALAVEGFRLEQRALLRAEIALLAADLAGRMRSNPAGRRFYDGAAADHRCASTMAAASRCSPDDLAAGDLSEITARLRSIAPGARLRVELPDEAPAVIDIGWDDGERAQAYRLAVAP